VGCKPLGSPENDTLHLLGNFPVQPGNRRPVPARGAIGRTRHALCRQPAPRPPSMRARTPAPVFQVIARHVAPITLSHLVRQSAREPWGSKRNQFSCPLPLWPPRHIQSIGSHVLDIPTRRTPRSPRKFQRAQPGQKPVVNVKHPRGCSNSLFPILLMRSPPQLEILVSPIFRGPRCQRLERRTHVQAARP
jgi:hypothetical protein